MQTRNKKDAFITLFSLFRKKIIPIVLKSPKMNFICLSQGLQKALPVDSIPLLCPVEPCYSAVAQRFTIQKYQQKDASIRGLKTCPHRNVSRALP